MGDEAGSGVVNSGSGVGSEVTSAGGEGSTRIPIISTVVSFLLFIIMKILSGLIQLGGSLVDYSLSFTSFTQAPVVQAGWRITRDLCNMGFAAILLFMAFATVLGQENYGLKKLLPRLIFVALLINFSLFFAGLIIDFSQVLTSFFIDAVKGDNGVAANIMNSLSLSRLYDFQKLEDQGFAATVLKSFMGVELSVIMEQIASCILFLITAFLFFAMALFMFSRLIAIWILLIFAPLAWLTYIVKIPWLADYSWDKWWQEFLKWTFFAPSYAFFIYLAVSVAEKLSSGSALVEGASLTAISENTKGVFSTGFFSSPTVLLQYIVVVMILMMGFKTALSVGGNVKVFGAGLAQKLAGAPKTLGKFAGGKVSQWAARGAKKEGTDAWSRFRRGTAYFSPDTWRRAWKERQAQKERESHGVAVGARQDTLNRLLSLGREKTDYRQRALRARRKEERGTITSNNAEELIAGYENAKKIKNTEKMAAFLQALTEQNDQNELFRHYAKTGQGNYHMNGQGWADFIEKEIKPAMGEQSAYRLGHDLTRAMEANGQWIGRLFTSDAKTGLYSVIGQDADPQKYKPWAERTAAEKEATQKIADKNTNIEWQKQDPQKQAIGLGRFSVIDESYDKDGNTIDNGIREVGKTRIAAISDSQAARINYHTVNNLLFNHHQEFAELNPASLEKIEGTMKKQREEDIKSRQAEVARPNEEKFTPSSFLDPEVMKKFAKVVSKAAEGGVREAQIGEPIISTTQERSRQVKGKENKEKQT